MTPEAKVKAKVKKVLIDIGAYYAMPVATGFFSSGFMRYSICSLPCQSGFISSSHCDQHPVLRKNCLI